MSIGFLVLLSLALGLAAWLFFVWTVKTGQYDDPEGAKYRMLEDEDEDAGGRGESRDERAEGGPAGVPGAPDGSPSPERRNGGAGRAGGGDVPSGP